jgi:hypothetical protein
MGGGGKECIERSQRVSNTEKYHRQKPKIEGLLLWENLAAFKTGGILIISWSG